jgi:hypothetical protein
MQAISIKKPSLFVPLVSAFPAMFTVFPDFQREIALKTAFNINGEGDNLIG